MNRLFFIIINFLIIIIVGYFQIFPQYRDIKDLSLTLTVKKNELKKKNDYFSEIRKTIDELKNYEEEVQKIKVALPSEPSPISLLYLIERTAIANGLSIKEIGEYKISDVERSLKEINFKIGLTGDYPALKNFLSSLEESARLIKVTNVSFKTPGEKESFIFSLEVKAYSY
jgi:Tfp pilus assembly protein PilO